MDGFDPNKWARVFARGTVRVSAPDPLRVFITNQQKQRTGRRGVQPPPVFTTKQQTLFDIDLRDRACMEIFEQQLSNRQPRLLDRMHQIRRYYIPVWLRVAGVR